ncbi:TetR family transcriptional regulator [Streptomyces finlayi]|uniref:TetR family transcriptional regulator n=1 Tax=Streptomyces finlayi TaxID=67296 RepID=A0A7G7BW22_9ACTN|nr:TetR family transcriptional regulator [Streptomyces finlayi]QNE79537.1 TetR family transcriptional regulator [Streptomyces finlayi]
MREALAEAAFQLFLERGYEQTTVDDIVARAGVGRRSFFRYFPSKEDAVFPDHESCLADMTALLDGRDGPDPVGAVCDAARLVMRMYAANPEFSVQRYGLTQEVPGLRTYELSVVRRYEGTLAGYLRRRWAESPDGGLRADVVAAAVVAAHNNALRSWLRSGGVGDAEAAVDHALGLVRDVWGSAAGVPAADGVRVTVPKRAAQGAPGGRGDGPAAESDDDVIVMVASRRAPMWRVVQSIEAAMAAG